MSIPRAKLVLRPAVYALILHNDKILLLNTRSTGKYSLPGGGVDIGEKMENALRREVREETGLEISIERLVGFKEHFFYYDPLDQAFHSFLFFYLCHPKTFDLLSNEEINDGEVDSPRWFNITTLRQERVQSHPELIIEIISRMLSREEFFIRA